MTAMAGESRMSSVLGLKVSPSTATVLPRTEPPAAAITFLAIARLRWSFTAATVSTILTGDADGDLTGQTIALLGLTFKPNTDDMRDSPAIAVIQALQDAGAAIRAFDPEGIEQAKLVLKDVDYAADPYACVTGADVAVLVTEWDAFRALDLPRVKSLMATPALVDLRNVYRPDEMARHGIAYAGVGR